MQPLTYPYLTDINTTIKGTVTTVFKYIKKAESKPQTQKLPWHRFENKSKNFRKLSHVLHEHYKNNDNAFTEYDICNEPIINSNG